VTLNCITEENLRVAALVKKLAFFQETRSFIFVFATQGHFIRSQRDAVNQLLEKPDTSSEAAVLCAGLSE
jgi:hypothetical protein